MKKLITLLLFLSTAALANDKITSLPGAAKLTQTQYAGYLSTGHNNKLFYWFVASKSPQTPIVLWSNGGPGYSSMYGFFNETGPYHITGAEKLSTNTHDWNRFANYLVIDQPANVGLSTTTGNHTLTSVSANTAAYYTALKTFLTRYPQYKRTPIYLAGESYAGTYLPLLAQKILQENKHSQEKINLKGLILISPWSDPKTQQSYDINYALKRHIITNKQAKTIQKTKNQCMEILNKKQQLKLANTVCGNIDAQIQQYSKKYMANIEQKNGGDDNTLLDGYLNKPSVRKAIHAQDSKPYHAWSSVVNTQYIPHIQESVRPVLDTLLSHKLPIMIISGLADGKDTNYLGVNAFIAKLKHPKQVVRVTVPHAGHMIPLDYPQVDQVVAKFIHKH